MLSLFLVCFVMPVLASAQGEAGFAPTHDYDDLITFAVHENIRGITVAPIEDSRLGDVGYGSPACEEALEQVAALGANWVSITPFGRMDDLESVVVQPDFEIPVDKNEEMIRATVRKAHSLGLKVALIPHIYVMSGEWRGQIDPGGKGRFMKWFKSYEAYLLRFAALAEEMDVELFSIGVEFASSTNFYDQRWRRLIKKVRKVYSGPLTYSANWDEYEYVQFWDELDYIGINGFWPLAGKPGDGYEEMREKAKAIAEDLEQFATAQDKSVLLTEFGVKSAKDAALAPWEWPEDCDGLVYDEAYQATAYDAFFEIMTPHPWFHGLFIWKYFSDPYDETQEERAGFTPKFKSAEQVLKNWFSRPWADPKNPAWGFFDSWIYSPRPGRGNIR